MDAVLVFWRPHYGPSSRTGGLSKATGGKKNEQNRPLQQQHQHTYAMQRPARSLVGRWRGVRHGKQREDRGDGVAAGARRRGQARFRVPVHGPVRVSRLAGAVAVRRHRIVVVAVVRAVVVVATAASRRAAPVARASPKPWLAPCAAVRGARTSKDDDDVRRLVLVLVLSLLLFLLLVVRRRPARSVRVGRGAVGPRQLRPDLWQHRAVLKAERNRV